MRALTLTDGHLNLAERSVPAVRTGSTLVRVLQAGICETDLQLMAGYMGFSGTLGHEFVGIAQSGEHVGKRVVGEINCVCHQCDMCLRGLGNHCTRRTVIGILNHDGAFAEYLTVPHENLHIVPDEISNDMATLVEPIAAALQITEQVNLTRGMRCYVVGDGRLGNLSAQVLHAAKCDVTVVGKHAEKLNTFQEIGVATCLVDEIQADRDGDLVVDCTGSETGLPTAFSLVRPRGTIVLKTTVANTHTLSLAPLVIDEIQLLGSRCGPFGRALAAIRQGDFRLDGFISGRYPLTEYRAAFEHAQRRDALKVILTCDS